MEGDAGQATTAATASLLEQQDVLAQSEILVQQEEKELFTDENPEQQRQQNRSQLSFAASLSRPVTQIQTTRTAATATAAFQDVFLIFFAAVGCTIAWTSLLSNLVFYTDTLGVDSYIYLNMCVSAPLFPITLTQAIWDADFDRQYRSLVTFSFRGWVGFLLTIICTLLLVPATNSHSLFWVCCTALVLGTASGILHGMLKQMASFVYPNCGRLNASVTSGMQASGLFVLLVTLFTNTTTKEGLSIFYYCIAGIVIVCWGCFQLLLMNSHDVQTSMSRRDSSLMMMMQRQEIQPDQQEQEQQQQPPQQQQQQQQQQQYTSSGESLLEPLIADKETEADRIHSTGDALPLEVPSNEMRNIQDINNPGDNNINRNDNDEEDISIDNSQEAAGEEMPILSLLKLSWPICLSILLTVSSSMSVASWFNRVESQDPTNNSLPQVLFYTRLVADFLGRPATLLLPSSMQSAAGNSSRSNNNNEDNNNHNNNSSANGSNINNSMGIISTASSISISSSTHYNMNTDNEGIDNNNNSFEQTQHYKWTIIMVLLAIVILRIVSFVPYFFLYTGSNSSIHIPKSDWGITFGVFLFAFSSGFLATWSYQLAPMLLTEDEREFNTVKQASLINVFFSASVLLGLVISFSLSAIGG